MSSTLFYAEKLNPVLSQSIFKNCYQGLCWLLGLSQKIGVANFYTRSLPPKRGTQRRNFTHTKELGNELSLEWPKREAASIACQTLYRPRGSCNIKSSLCWLTLPLYGIDPTPGDKVATTALRAENFNTAALGKGQKYFSLLSNRSHFNSLPFACVWRFLHLRLAKQTIDFTGLW